MVIEIAIQIAFQNSYNGRESVIVILMTIENSYHVRYRDSYSVGCPLSNLVAIRITNSIAIGIVIRIAVKLAIQDDSPE